MSSEGFTTENHAGLATAARPAVLERVLAEFDLDELAVSDYPSPAPGLAREWSLSNAYVPARSFPLVPDMPATCTLCVLVRPLRGGSAPVTLVDSIVAHVLSGVGVHALGCHLGSAPLPNGGHRRPTSDGAQVCLAGGQAVGSVSALLGTGRRSRLVDCDVVNTDGRWTNNAGLAHMDGVQCWDTGRLDVIGCKVDGWWQSALMLKSDRGPIDDVLVHGCDLGGGQWFQVRVIDGGHGRPTNVTLTENVFRPGAGRAPVNSGNDRCTDVTQARYVRTEALRWRPEWIVYRDNVTPDGVEVPPPGGWFDPGPITIQSTPPTGGTP